MPPPVFNAVDRELLHEAIDGFVPGRVIDFHAHVYDPRFYAPGSLGPEQAEQVADFATIAACVQALLPGRTLEGSLVFPYPALGNDRPGLNAWMFSDLAGATHRAAAGLALVAPGDDQEVCGEWLAQKRCAGLKPYFIYGRTEAADQSAVEDYAPEWMWRLCDRHGGILMLHLARDAAVSDPVNREALLRLSARYPDCRVILAHCARAFNHRTARGLPALASRPNIHVDTSAITEPEAMKIALASLGPGRVLYGSDYPESHVRGRCVTAGNSAQWIYADTMNNPAMTLVGIESLRSLREAAEQLRLGSADIERIFSGNARALLGWNASD